MIIKKFQGKTEAEAVIMAQKELGDNVVIMNVKQVKRKGFFRLFRAQIIEITVGKEEEHEKMAKMEMTNRAIDTTFGFSKEEKKPQFSIFTQELIEKTEVESKREPEIGREPSIRKEPIAGNAIEEKLDSLQSLLEKQLKKPDEEKIEEKEQEKPSETELFMKILYNTMLENEVKEVYANQIIDEIDKVNKPNMPIDYILANIYQRMILKFGNAEGIGPGNKRPKVIFFVGPTGVGKTTTIAKIASKFSVDEKKKIALLTADTYRIAAAEQLRTYANILAVPFRVIYTKEELQESIKELTDFDYILVDTAGHSHQNERQKASISELINSLPTEIEKETFLVVSATTKYRDLTNIADTYSAITSYKIIFTKLDETITLGNLFNLRLHTGAPLAYVTCGQNVPDDIENFNPQKTVKLLLGGKS